MDKSYPIRLGNKKSELIKMNTTTIIVTVLTLWLVMGLSFLSVYLETRRKSKPPVDAWISYEGLLFIASILVPLILLIHGAASG